jgi:hypothetical protein
MFRVPSLERPLVLEECFRRYVRQRVQTAWKKDNRWLKYDLTNNCLVKMKKKTLIVVILEDNRRLKNDLGAQ